MTEKLTYWVCKADGEEFTPADEAKEFGVIGCHAFAPHLYDPDEYDDDHNGCGWARVEFYGRKRR